jgi:hypothetical protein
MQAIRLGCINRLLFIQISKIGEIAMFKIQKSLLVALLITLLLILAACNLPSNRPTQVPSATATTFSANPQLTAAAQTVSAVLTQSAGGQPPVIATTPALQQSPTATLPPPTLAPTNTQAPPPQPTATPVPPSPTPVPIPCDRATFVKDVTFPDDSEVVAGKEFIKTWRIKNNGSCTWTSGYAVVFDKGDAMNGPASQQLTTGTVAPGQEIDISVTLKAPDATGTYQGYWKLRNSTGATFGIGDAAQKSFWVKVKAISPVTSTPNATVNFDFFAKGPNAEWRNGSGPLPWGDPVKDNPGVAAPLENIKANDGKTYAKALATYPQRITDGLIMGIFPAYTVQEGDHFRALLGFRQNCDSGNVKFQLKYREGSTEVLLGEWLKGCDSNIIGLDLDLAGLKGKSVQFILVVLANGSADDDRAMWILPRIEK